MSTINTENLTLYANPYLYNGSRYVFYQTGRDYETWLRENSERVVTKTVYFKSLTEEMELNSPPGDIMRYPYGKITNNDKDYYIFIDRITTDEHGKSYIKFSVDWWATEWVNLHPTKAHLTRSPNKPGYMAQPWTPLKTSFDSVPLDGENSKKGSIMFTYIPSNEGQDSYISLGFIELNDKNLSLVQNGYWYQKYHIPGSDIKDCFVVPMISPDDIATEENTYVFLSLNSNESETQGTVATMLEASFEYRFPDIVPTDYFPQATTTIIPDDFGRLVYNEASNKFYRMWYTHDVLYGDQYFCREISINLDTYKYKFLQTEYIGLVSGEYIFDGYYMTINDAEVDTYEFEITGLNITSTEKEVQGISDWNSDIIWECPYNAIITSFTVRLLTGISHIMLEFIPNGSTKNGSKLTGAGFSYDCRHPGLFVDEYRDYILKNRDYDIAMRQIQSEKQIWTAGFSTAENIGFGYAFGKVPGAQAAGAGGLLETLGTYLINSEFDPRIQEQYDIRYARMTDQISLVGDSITDVYYEKDNGLLQIYSLVMDTATQTRMDTDIEVNGYVCDETVANLEQLFGEGVIIKADNIIIEGATCLDAKQQTVYRLQNGVEFI